MKGSVIYPGFFDPFTLGHLNIVKRAEKVFERVIVAVSQDSHKHAMFTPQERFDMIQYLFRSSKHIKVERFDGLLVEHLKKRKGAVVLRGIRTVSDFEYEYQMTLANKTLSPEVETFFMMTEGHYSFLSSTVIKEIARLGGSVDAMVPKEIATKIQKKYEK